MQDTGELNVNKQRLVRKTTERGNTDHSSLWVAECSECGHEYGLNGFDFHIRKCPSCQGGKPGLDVPE